MSYSIHAKFTHALTIAGKLLDQQICVVRGSGIWGSVGSLCKIRELQVLPQFMDALRATSALRRD